MVISREGLKGKRIYLYAKQPHDTLIEILFEFFQMAPPDFQHFQKSQITKKINSLSNLRTKTNFLNLCAIHVSQHILLFQTTLNTIISERFNEKFKGKFNGAIFNLK